MINLKKIIADAHVDTLEYMYDNKMDLDNRKLSFNLIDIKDNMPYIQLMACFVHDKYMRKGFNRIKSMLDYYYVQEEKFNILRRINTKKDIDILRENNKVGVILTAENGVCLDENLENIYKLYKKGVKIMTITWNYNNQLGCGNLTSRDFGLTSFGKKSIREMNNLDMIVDVSHSSTKTFWDIMSITDKPVIASHSNVYNICKNSRNLTDMQIKEIAKNNGIIGITYYNKFLTDNKQAGINDIVNHIEYLVNLVGIEYVCLGSDFDGVDKNDLPQNLKGLSDVNKLKECLLYRGFKTREIEKIMGENLVRFIQCNI